MRLMPQNAGKIECGRNAPKTWVNYFSLSELYDSKKQTAERRVAPSPLLPSSASVYTRFITVVTRTRVRATACVRL